MKDEAITAAWPILQYADGSWTQADDEVAEEKPLTIKLDGQEFATIVCSPSDWDDLLYGFLASEGVILTADDVASLDWDEGTGMARIALKRKMTLAEADFGKRVIGSCCGKSRQFYLRADVKTAKTSVSRVTVTPEECLAAMEELQLSSGVFARTGGVHNAALYVPGTAAELGRTALAVPGTAAELGRTVLAAPASLGSAADGERTAKEPGELGAADMAAEAIVPPAAGSASAADAAIVRGGRDRAVGAQDGKPFLPAGDGSLLAAVRSDIGRHNALDKLYGHCIRSGIPGRDKAIIFSGRLSSEVVLKTAKIGAAILIAKSAPTALALRLAHDLGITAVGFVRRSRFNVYTHPQRIVMTPK